MSLTAVIWVFIAVACIGLLVWSWVNYHYRFRDDARLFDLHRRQRDIESDLTSTDAQFERAFSRIGDLEDRVARLEDPYGKKKRGYGIYDFTLQQAIPGLLALQERMREGGYEVTDADVAEATHWILGEDGELKGNSHE